LNRFPCPQWWHPARERVTWRRYLEAFDSNVVEARDGILETSDEHLLGRLSFELNGKAVLCMPREAVIRHVVLGRLKWQRAMLAMYLELARGAIGPSPDKIQGCNSAVSSECRQA
jgi:hypothetical protein